MNDSCKLFEKSLSHQIHLSPEKRLYELRKHGNISTINTETKRKKLENEMPIVINIH